VIYRISRTKLFGNHLDILFMLTRILGAVIGSDVEYISGAGYKYNGVPFTGIEYLLDENGFVIEEISYFEGLLWGFSRRWTSKGILREHYTLSFGGADKGFKKWYLDGSLKEESFIEHGVTARRKRWDKEGKLIEDFNIENEPEHSRYQSWLLGKNYPDPEKTAGILELEKQILAFEQEIAAYLAKYPSSKFHHQNDFTEENVTD
jgi:antitoxin component YwqK of YwqJK toxin-antitoxin module